MRHRERWYRDEPQSAVWWIRLGDGLRFHTLRLHADPVEGHHREPAHDSQSAGLTRNSEASA
jgi:hypothetical protein